MSSPSIRIAARLLGRGRSGGADGLLLSAMNAERVTAPGVRKN